MPIGHFLVISHQGLHTYQNSDIENNFIKNYWSFKTSISTGVIFDLQKTNLVFFFFQKLSLKDVVS